MILFIKNMVCNRCIMTVEQQLSAFSIPFKKVGLGEIELDEAPSDEQFIQLKQGLHLLGFEILDDRKASIVSQIKACIIKYIHWDDDSMNKKLSVHLSETLRMDYNYLSALFSSI